MAVVRGKWDVRDHINAQGASKDLRNEGDGTRGPCQSQIRRQPTRNKIAKKQVRCQHLPLRSANRRLGLRGAGEWGKSNAPIPARLGLDACREKPMLAKILGQKWGRSQFSLPVAVIRLTVNDGRSFVGLVWILPVVLR